MCIRDRGYTDFDENPQGVEKISLVKRWRLEPKAKDLEKYKRGELVEPEKPIVFYIDPLTPKKWIPYLMQGVNDWQKAFEKAGFKNAIYAKVPNAKDEPDWSLEDARFSAIVYKPVSYTHLDVYKRQVLKELISMEKEALILKLQNNLLSMVLKCQVL